MSIVTLGYVEDSIVTQGYGGTWIAKLLRRAGGFINIQKKPLLVKLQIQGNTSIPFSFIEHIIANFSEVFSEVFSMVGFNRIPIRNKIPLKGNTYSKKQTLINTTTQGRKSFKEIIKELLFNDED